MGSNFMGGLVIIWHLFEPKTEYQSQEKLVQIFDTHVRNDISKDQESY